MIDRVGQFAANGLVVVTITFLILPILLTVVMALDARPFMGYFPPPALTTKWLMGLFDLPEFSNGAKVAFLVACSATFIVIAFSVPARRNWLTRSRQRSQRNARKCSRFTWPPPARKWPGRRPRPPRPAG